MENRRTAYDGLGPGGRGLDDFDERAADCGLFIA